MLFNHFNLKTKTLKIISLSLTLSGIIFILASSYIGAVAVRLAMILLLGFCFVNLKMTYVFLSQKDRMKYYIAIAASILGIIRPDMSMFLIGILLLFATVPPYVNFIKIKDYSDVVMLIINGAGILFAFYCIINSRAALNTVVIIIGIILTITGCLALYELFSSGIYAERRAASKNENRHKGFENTDNL